MNGNYATPGIFTGYQLQTPSAAGYLSLREQSALVEHVVKNLDAMPATQAHEVRLLLEGRSHSMSDETKQALVQIGMEFIDVTRKSRARVRASSR